MPSWPTSPIVHGVTKIDSSAKRPQFVLSNQFADLFLRFYIARDSHHHERAGGRLDRDCVKWGRVAIERLPIVGEEAKKFQLVGHYNLVIYRTMIVSRPNRVSQHHRPSRLSPQAFSPLPPHPPISRPVAVLVSRASFPRTAADASTHQPASRQKSIDHNSDRKAWATRTGMAGPSQFGRSLLAKHRAMRIASNRKAR